MGKAAVVEDGEEAGGLVDQVVEDGPAFRGGEAVQAGDVSGQFHGVGGLFGEQVALADGGRDACGATPPAAGASAGRAGAGRAP